MLIMILQLFINVWYDLFILSQSENTYAAIVGDFDINLLHISECKKIDEFFDFMCTNDFFPLTTFSTFARYSRSLIDQIFCKNPHKNTWPLHHLSHIVNLGFSEKIKSDKNMSDREQSEIEQ